jgi:hypothetical protein
MLSRASNNDLKRIMCGVAGCALVQLVWMKEAEAIAAWNRRAPAERDAEALKQAFNAGHDFAETMRDGESSPPADVVTEENHEEALQLAHIRKNESNLARCYIALRAARYAAFNEGVEEAAKLADRTKEYSSRDMEGADPVVALLPKEIRSLKRGEKK